MPAENLLGQEGKGFKYIMDNFNHERFLICVMTNRFARVCFEEALKFSNKRKTFGKPLVDNQATAHAHGKFRTSHEIHRFAYGQSFLICSGWPVALYITPWFTTSC